MNGMAIALVSLMFVAACTALAILTWGLVLEARSNREWRAPGRAS